MLAPAPIIEVDEEVYRYAAPDNGAGPQWCHGSTTLARVGTTVFISATETIPGVKPLHNVRWQLWVKRGDDPWQMAQADPSGRTREPAPLGVLPGKLLLSVNPTLTPPDTYSGPAQPHLLEFSTADLAAPATPRMPRWSEEIKFTEHSYRSFAVDSAGGEALLLNNLGYDRAYWSLLDHQGNYSAAGRLNWPWGADYAKPQPIRLCYPNVLLRNRQVHFLGVSDIDEPNPQFAKAKFELTKQKWDYDFRRLFYAWTPDITKEAFRPWQEIASVDQTCGWIWSCDLHLDAEGTAHLLWVERSIDTRLRAQFFPDAKLTWTLRYARLKDGQVLSRATLVAGGEGLPSADAPRYGRFHVTPSGRLLVLVCMSLAEGKQENRLLEIYPDGTTSAPVTLGLQFPFTQMVFTATPRGGSAPSAWLDLHGQVAGKPLNMRYARVKVE